MSEEPCEKGLKKVDEDAEERPRPKTKHELHEEDPEKYSDEDEEEDDDAGGVGGGAVVDEGLLRRLQQIKLSAGVVEKTEKPEVLSEVSFRGIVDHIKSGKAKNIITLAGAGISTSAGIPDFRSPETGLYHNLAKYDLPSPQAIFSIDFFRLKPEPFYQLAKELYPGQFEPTPSHYLIRLLHEKGLLLRHYTQNIDTLERVAGIPGEKIVEAHGTFHTAHCIGCNMEYSQDWVKERMVADNIPKCEKCQSTVKPDIIFFGEALPKRFFNLAKEDFPRCDLLIIMGTSLTVQPFASLIDRVSASCPRLLINLTKAGCSSDESDFLLRLMGRSGGLDFDSEDNFRDVARLGTCDQGCADLAEALGWKDDLQALVQAKKSGSSL